MQERQCIDRLVTGRSILPSALHNPDLEGTADLYGLGSSLTWTTGACIPFAFAALLIGWGSVGMTSTLMGMVHRDEEEEESECKH